MKHISEGLKPAETPRPSRDFRNEHELAEIEQAIRTQAGIKTANGNCGACRGMQWLRADVPLSHKLFGKIRCCVCNPQYEQFGGVWFNRHT